MNFKKITQNLTLWVLTAIVAGALLGHFEPATAVKMEFLGKRFIDVVKLFINPIIFLTITLGISTMGDLKKVGRIGGKALLYFEIVTTLALFIGVAVAAVVRPGDGVARQHGPAVDLCVLGAAIGPMNTAGAIADRYGLDPPLSAQMVGLGIPLSLPLLAALGWWLTRQ